MAAVICICILKVMTSAAMGLYFSFQVCVELPIHVTLRWIAAWLSCSEGYSLSDHCLVHVPLAFVEHVKVLLPASFYLLWLYS